MTAQTPATPAIPKTMKAVVMRAPGDVVVEEVDTPRVAQPTDVVLKLAA
ncbi:IMP dehydrogenase, partial [Micrococcus luteus]|nr:IMP dehydrogenase [Micrococcus luteus]